MPSRRLVSMAALVAFAICVFASDLHGQSKLGFRSLESGNQEAAFTAFQNGLSNEKDEPFCLFGLAQLAADKNWKHYNGDSAFVKITLAEKRFRKLPYKTRNRLQKSWNKLERSALKKLIINQLTEEAVNSGSPEQITAVIERYKMPYKQKKATEILRNELAYDLAKVKDSVWVYQDLMKRYGKSIRERMPSLYKDIEYRIFEASMRENSWDNFEAFAEQYPNNPYTKDANKAAWDSIRTTNNIDAYWDFIVKSPSSAYSRLAKDSIFVHVMRSEDIEDLKFFLDNLSNHEMVTKVWVKFYHFYRVTNGTIEGLQKFLKLYPNYPYPEQVNRDVQGMIDQEFVYLTTNDDYERSKQFVESWPNYERSEEVWLKFYDLYKEANPGTAAIEKFRNTYPRFPQPDRFEADMQQAASFDCANLAETGGLTSCKKFIEQYPDLPCLGSVWSRYYQVYKEKNQGLEYLLYFQKNFPEFPHQDSLSKDIERYRADEEKYDFANLKDSWRVNDYFRFAKKYPESRFLPEMEAPLLELVLDHHEIDTYGRFLSLYPESGKKRALVDGLFERLAFEGKKQLFEEHKTVIADYPDQDQLKRAIATAEHAANIKLDGAYSPARGNLYDFIKKNAPAQPAFKALLLLVEPELRVKNYENSKKLMLTFKDYFKEDNPYYNQLLTLLSKPYEDLVVESIGFGINTRNAEFEPIIAVDDQTLWFSGRGRADNIGGEDIFQVERTSAENWGTPTIVKELSTIGDNESVESISADGKTMLLFYSGILSSSELIDGKWSTPQPLPSVVNRTDWQSDARLTADGNAILFASRKSNGDVDLYVCEKQKDGSWGKGINLGRTINTSGIDRSPFLHPDGKTLYFSSDGHAGLGKLDIFKTTRMGDGWTNWSTPENLGLEVNTTSHDWGYRVSTDGKTGYFTKHKGRNFDIYTITVSEDAKPGKVSLVAGKILDGEGNPLAAEIVWRDFESKRVLLRTQSDSLSGDFFASLPKAIVWEWSAQKSSFKPESGQLDLSSGHRNETLDIVLFSTYSMIDNDLRLPINNLFFETGSFELEVASYSALNDLATFVLDNNLNIEILGHTDNVGSDSNNKLLSEKRANTVKEYLQVKGCDATRILAKGFGETQPKTTNDSEEGRATNRRVEIRVLK